MNLLQDQSAAQSQMNSGEGTIGPAFAAQRPMTAGIDEQALFHVDLMRSLQLHRRLAVGVALAGLVVAAGYLLSLWPIYTAQSLLYVQPAPQKVMDQGNSARWPYDSSTYESFIQQQVQNITRADVLIGALHKLEPGTWQKKNESDQAAAERLGKTVDATRLGTSYQIAIAARASNAVVAAKLANAVTASYLESASLEEKSGDTQRLAMLREEEERVEKELEADRAEQQDLNNQLGMAGVGTTTPDLYDDDLSRLRDELIKARTASDEAAARLTSLDGNRASSAAALEAEADQLVVSDPSLVSMKTSLNERRATIVSQMANLTPRNPQYKQDAQELAQINDSLESMLKEMRAKVALQVQRHLRMDLERTAGVESRLNGQLGKMAAAAASVTPKMQRANDLATDIVRLQTRYTSVDERMRNLQLEDSAPGTAFLAVAAVPPLHATKSGVLRNAMMISIAGLVFALVAAVGANKLDQKVYIAADIEQVLGFAPMAVLPDFSQVTNGVAEEHMLRLSAGIEYARQQGNLRSCIFTGTAPGAGVTTVATRVRSMLETMGRATVLVDASGTPPPPPRSNSGGTGTQPGMHETSSQLATQRGSRSTALLQQLADEAESERESLVITDTAPLTVSAETEYLARFVDAAIVVVESGVTTRAQLREVAGSLQRLDVAAVGFVLNRVGTQKADPAFRESVRAIEQHLRAQSRSCARNTERSRPAEAANQPKTEQVEKEGAREAKTRQTASKPAAETAVRPPSQAIPGLPVGPPPLAEVSRSADGFGAKMPRVEELRQPTPIPTSPISPRQPVQQESQVRQAEISRPVKPQQPVRVPEPRVAVSQPVMVREPAAAATPQPAQRCQWLILGCRPPSRGSVFQTVSRKVNPRLPRKRLKHWSRRKPRTIRQRG